MKKIAKIILAVLIVLINIQILQAFNGDLKISGLTGYTTSARIEIVSVPFEGITSPKSPYEQYNRVGEVLSGAYWRFYDYYSSNHLKRNIAFLDGTVYDYSFVHDLGHCSAPEYPLDENQLVLNNAWGFAKYKITITFTNQSNNFTEVYKLYLNSLDSKYGDKNHGGYSADLYLEYDDSQPINERLHFRKALNGVNTTVGRVKTFDVLPNGEPSKEFKVWEIAPLNPYTEPLAKNFKAKSTPFPINPRAIRDEFKRDLELGTDVILDGVYEYTGESDRYGYNTIDSGNVNFWWYYYTNPPIPGYNHTLDRGKTYVTPATVYYDNVNDEWVQGFRLNVRTDNKITITNDKRLWVSGIEWTPQVYKGDTIFFHEGAKLVMEANAQLNTCRGGKIVDSSSIITWNPNAFMRINNYSEIAFWLNNNVINNGAHIEVDGGGTFKVHDNSTVTFDGAGTYLKLNPNAIVQLGENAKIEFKNGAYLDANGSNISSLPNKQGWGIELINSGEQTVITNCYFTNLTRALYFNNTDAGHANLLRNISGNTFTGNANCMMLLGTNNTNAIHVMNNNFNMSPSIGFGVFMGFNSGNSGNEATGASYNLYFQGNSFVNGNVSALFWSETSNYPFITFKYNTITGSTNNTNLLLRQISGDFKNNSIVNNSGFNFDIRQSSPNILSNTMTSPNLNILNTAAYPIMAPVSNNSSDGGWIWKGGSNDITSNYNDNVNYDNGNILLDWGQNCFLKGANKKHLIGGIDEPTYVYKVRNNDFNNSNMPVCALYYYYNINQQVTPYDQGSSFGCNNSTDLGTVWQINDLGNGVYDTVFKSNNTSGYQPQPDEANYSTATIKMAQEMHFDAISYFKTLINNYPSSSYTDACLYKLYECYVNLDTSGNQSIRDILFNDLRNYLNNKILSGIYSNEFNNIAYNVTVMCEAYIGNYNEALEGYEFISLYHPDMYIRLLASWDYAEILELLNGPGGISSKELYMTDKEYMSHITKRINKLAANDPVKKKVKKSFLKMKEDRKIAIEKDIMTKTKDDKTMKIAIAKLQKEDQKIENRVIKVLRYANTMSEDEKIKQQMEDILLSRYKGNISSEVLEIKTPGSYELSQNYPNPFNPMTKINFALPKQGFVSLKIYDITGREIKTLVNDVKQAGYYTVDFNGSSLASGVYFYRIQSGDFISVKRMVLVK